MHLSADCVVAGAGVVGLAVARALALTGREVIVLDTADGPGEGVSSRNSEVIHAGIYYPRHSLKARTCVAGRAMLYSYLDERGVPYRRCGKLIVATDEREAAQLDAIRLRALANGVIDLEVLDGAEASRIEPALRCVAALFSPSTGIIDSHLYMLALQGEAEANGAVFAFRTRVARGEVRGDGILLHCEGDEPCTLSAGAFVNAAGLNAQALARSIEGFPQAAVPPLYLAKGNYFSLTGASPFRRLIYPAPVAGGLGVHLTLDMAGQARFGPDVEWTDAVDYGVDPSRCDGFYDVIRRYWPGLADGALQPAYSGIRPKLAPAGAPDADFIVSGPADHGIPGIVNLFGIESPGLTASLALAEMVAAALETGAQISADRIQERA